MRTVALRYVLFGSDDPKYLGFQKPPESYQKYEHWLQTSGLRQEKRSTVSASGGQTGAAVWVNTLQKPGYSPRWCTLLTTTTLLSQRAGHSPLWLETFTKRRIRRGTTRIFVVRCDKAKRGCASRVPPSPAAAPGEGGAGGAGGARRSVPGSQPTQCNTLGLARGCGPFEPPTGGSSPLPPHHPAPFPLSHDGGLDGADPDLDSGGRLPGRRESRAGPIG